MKTEINAQVTIKLTIKGHQVELTREEATELAKALAAATGSTTSVDQIRKLIEGMQPRIEKVYVPQSIPLPYTPKWPSDGTWRDKIWCSTDKTMSLSYEPRF